MCFVQEGSQNLFSDSLLLCLGPYLFYHALHFVKKLPVDLAGVALVVVRAGL